MATKRVVTRNVIWNLAGMVVPTLSGFLVAPFLVHRLGDTAYGLWILIGSLSGYFGLLDLGVRGSVGRNIALHRAQGDRRRVNAMFSTALAYLCGVGGVVALASFAAPPVFFRLFDVPAGETADVRLALILVGLNLALWLPLNVFDATLWAFQRFDLLNAVDTPATLLRTGLTFWVVAAGHGLVGLAVVTLLSTVAAGTAKGLLSFRIDRGLRLGPAHVDREAARGLFGYSIWYFLLSVTRLLPPQISPLIIGARLTVALVTPFSIAGRLITYANAMLTAATGVLTPVATTYHAEEDHARQRRLFLSGGKYCLGLALFVMLLFVFLGEPVITLWMGTALQPAPLLLAILALGEVLPMAQWVTQSMILGMGRHRMLALVSVAEIAAAVVLALLLVGPYGLVGVCVAFALPGAVCRGLIQGVYGCRLAGVSLGEYAIRSLLPAAAAAVLPGVGLALLTSWQAPTSWPGLVGCTALFGVSYAVCFVLVAGREHIEALRSRWSKRSRREAAPAETAVPLCAGVGE